MTRETELVEQIGKLAGTRVLCVGDIMLDRFVYGKVERISPEAPVPVLRIEREHAMLGGVGNVVSNLVAFGSDVCLVGLIGRDPAGREVMQLLADEPSVESHLLYEDNRQTTIKIRYVAGAQQLLRADQEIQMALGAGIEDQAIQRAEADMNSSAALVLSDYGKGVLTDKVLRKLIDRSLENGMPVIVDPKGNDYSRYRGATLVTPNRRELSEATGMPAESDDEIIEAGKKLIKDSGIENILITRSQDGMTLVHGDGTVDHFPASAQEVFDVSGAGDTVVAVIAASLGAGLNLADASALANVAAGLVVAKMGTAVVTADELSHALRSEDLLTVEAKTLSLEATLEQVAVWRSEGLKVGFTNGCFDLLHPGHVSLLRRARATCDRLIIGLNSDTSVTQLKGPDRPLQSEAARATVLGSMESVDAVVIFAEETPQRLIEAIRPDLLIKGADYTVEQVAGAEFVQSTGGRVVLIPIEEGHSTSNIVTKMASGK